ncbi:MAG TPA: kelch repeat-containing protein [Holophaga sp.]|nr:kelch repeat-containing protein [Holophaga sp.]
MGFVMTAICLAASLCAVAAPPKPARAGKAPAKAGTPVLKADPGLPAPGAAGERIDPATGRGRSIGPMGESRADFQATLLPGGRVLVTGGTARTATSEWFDPATGRFSPGPALTRPRQGHRALLLKDGRLLLVGGTEPPAPAEVLDQGAAAFRALPDAAFGLSAEAVELDEGRVVLVDGASGAIHAWDGRKSTSRKATLARPRIFFRALRLKEGKVAILGGWPSDARIRGRKPAPGGDLPVEVFNPKWSSLSSWSRLPLPRARHQASLLEDGRVVLFGGVGADGETSVAAREILDPAKESITVDGSPDLGPGAGLGWTEGWFLPERGRQVLRAAGPLDLPGGRPAGRLANPYLAPILVPLGDGGLLVLGTCAYGDPLDRWDPRSHACSVLGTLRADAKELAQLPDGRVLSLGPVVDLVDLRTGALSPLGWREDLEPLLKTLKPAPPSPGTPPFPPGQAREGAAAVALDKGRALVVGGARDGEPSGNLEIWDLKKKTLGPAGVMKTRRAAPSALKLNDGTVLVWGAGKE